MTKILFNSIRKQTNQPPPSNISNISPSISAHPTNTEEDSTTPVTIYLHYPSFKSVKVTIGPQLSMLEIKQVVEDKLGVKKDRQILHLNGKNVTEYGNVRLQANNIIHVSDFEKRCNREENITVKLTIVNFATDNKDKLLK